MNDRMRTATLVLLAAAGACGGSRAGTDLAAPGTVGPDAVVSTPAVHELARLQEEGRIDPARTSCAAVELAALMPDLAPILPVLWGAAAPRYTVEASSHAQSVQDGMAASDVRTSAMRRASQARHTAAYATRVGDNVLAAQAANYALGAMRTAQRAAPTEGVVRWQPPRWRAEDGPILEEYAELFVRLVTEEAATPPEVRDRLAEIGERSPHVMEAYAGLLLEAYADPDLTCAPGDRRP